MSNELKQVAMAVGGTYVGAKVKSGIDDKVHALIVNSLKRSVKYNKKVIQFIEFVEVGLYGGVFNCVMTISMNSKYSYKNTEFMEVRYISVGNTGKFVMKLVDLLQMRTLSKESIPTSDVGFDDCATRLNALLADISSSIMR